MAFPQFTDLWIQRYNGSNRYNALQLQLSERLSKDLTLSASYTRSRLREKLDYLNPTDTTLESRISPDDRPDRLTFSAVYQLPIGHDQRIGRNANRFVDAVIGGWQVATIGDWRGGSWRSVAGNRFQAGDPRLSADQRQKLEKMEQRHRRQLHRQGFLPDAPP